MDVFISLGVFPMMDMIQGHQQKIAILLGKSVHNDRSVILQGSLLAAELITAHDRMNFEKRSIVSGAKHSSRLKFERRSIGSGAKHSS